LDSARRFGKHHIGADRSRAFLESSANALLRVCSTSIIAGGQQTQLGASTVANCASHEGARAGEDGETRVGGRRNSPTRQLVVLAERCN